ncbi:MAG: hypothetical protein QOF76_3745 [Solirubrobacteraceae bacterium]|nr:hypothetical protein [Solirubrobacteraceae bacterium]
MTALPDWPEGTVAVLSTAGPHAIPVSACVRAGDSALVLGLGRRRESLLRLRESAEVAVLIMCGRDVAVTAYGTASVVSEDAAGVVAVRVDVTSVQDHFKPDFTISAGVDWAWTDDAAAERDARVRAALKQHL